MQLRTNTLAPQSYKWTTEFNVQSQSVEVDTTVADAIKIELAFDSLSTVGSESSEISTDLEYVQANSIYNVKFCALYSLPAQN